MRMIVCGLVLVGLIGCSPPASGPAPVQFDVTGPQAAETVDRLDLVSVRTFSKTGLRRQEIVALPCTALGTGLRASFTSPATLAVPTYLGRTDPISITCQLRQNTVKTATLQISPINQTEEDLDTGLRVGVSSSDGVSVRLGVSIRDRDRDRFDYPYSVLIDFPS